MVTRKIFCLCFSAVCFFLFCGMIYPTQVETNNPMSENVYFCDPDGCIFFIEATPDEMMVLQKQKKPPSHKGGFFFDGED